jgi:chaperone protein EcpD
LQDDPTAGRALLKWHVEANDKGERVIRLNNPSPYYVSVGSAQVAAGNREVSLRPDMAPPFGYVDLVPEAGALDIQAPATISYTVLNDFGTPVKDSAEVRPMLNTEAQKGQ